MKNDFSENNEQNEKATKIKDSNEKHEPPIKTPSTDNKKNLAKDTEGLNQANSIHNNLEPGDKRN